MNTDTNATESEIFSSFIVRYTFSRERSHPRYYFRLRDASPDTGCEWVVVELSTTHEPSSLNSALLSLLLDAFRSGNSVDLAIGTAKKQFFSHPLGPQENELVAPLKAISLSFNF